MLVGHALQLLIPSCVIQPHERRKGFVPQLHLINHIQVVVIFRAEGCMQVEWRPDGRDPGKSVVGPGHEPGHEPGHGIGSSRVSHCLPSPKLLLQVPDYLRLGCWLLTLQRGTRVFILHLESFILPQ